MKSQIRRIFLFFTTFIIIIDAITFAGFLNDFSWSGSMPAVLIYWIIPVIFITSLQLYGRKFLASNRPGFFAGFYVFAGYFLAFYVPKLFYAVFILTEYALKIVAYPVSLIFPDILNTNIPFGEFMIGGPLNFISLIVLPLSLLSFIVILAGMAFGRFNFKVRHMGIDSPDLPSHFDGFKLIQISDLHLGSLYGHEDKIRKVVDLINRESPDIIVFTGDLVNNLAAEAEGWTEILNEMKSRYGNFSILGNHDYGEYYNWPSEEARQENMNDLLAAHKDSGFTVLLNQSARISLNGQNNVTGNLNITGQKSSDDKGDHLNITGQKSSDDKGDQQNSNQEIFVAGVENWGLPPFKQYGDLEKALVDIPEKAYTILLSHDPSHWDAEVLNKSTVNLTLSGHTHGMQFGIRTKKFKWSPVQMKYPRWIGLYQQGYRYLHVNPGLGYIGYAGRIWIPPEISVITLKKSN
jgi:predicted MPP superfamily phosphohydrolase